MADTFNGKLEVSTQWSLSEAQDLSNVVDADRYEISQSFTDGSSDDQCTVKWSDSRVLAASSSETLDLTALTETIFGSSVTKSFATIKSILIHNTTETSGVTLRVGAAASNQWTAPFTGSGAPTTATIDIPAGGSLMLIAPNTGYTVTNSSSDNLKIANQSGATTCNYNIIIFGT